MKRNIGFTSGYICKPVNIQNHTKYYRVATIISGNLPNKIIAHMSKNNYLQFLFSCFRIFCFFCAFVFLSFFVFQYLFLVFFCVFQCFLCFFGAFLGHFLSIHGLFLMISCQLFKVISQTNKKKAGRCLVVVCGFQGRVN